LIEKDFKKLSATNLNFERAIQLREEILKLQEELPKD